MTIKVAHKTFEVIPEDHFLIHYWLDTTLESAEITRLYDEQDEIWYRVVTDGRIRYLSNATREPFFFDQRGARKDDALAGIIGTQIKTHYGTV